MVEFCAAMTDTDVKPKTKVKTKTERPRLHKVILVNDDYTPREFVVSVLKAEFRMNEGEAYKVMMTAHRRGVCVVAVYAKAIAETQSRRAAAFDSGVTRCTRLAPASLRRLVEVETAAPQRLPPLALARAQ